MNIGAVVLAAGLSRRFGSNKLLALIGDRPMVQYAFDLLSGVEACCRRATVVSDPRVAELARSCGMEVVFNPNPELGQARSIALAVEAAKDLDAVLLMTGDQPGLLPSSLNRLVDSFVKSQKGLACMQDSTHMGNPAIFSSAYFPHLMALRGDCGGKRILSAFADDLCVVACEKEGELGDVDTPQALCSLKILR